MRNMRDIEFWMGFGEVVRTNSGGVMRDWKDGEGRMVLGLKEEIGGFEKIVRKGELEGREVEG